jgi:hypothetical protein
MSEEDSERQSMLEAHEEFIQHIETGSSKIRTLSVTTLVVAVLLVASYLYQLVLPYITNATTVTVDLLDPTLQVTEVVVLVIALAWFYVALRDYFFTTKLIHSIKEIRRQESEIEKRITG